MTIPAGFNRITELAPNEVFVFGSNLRGCHGAGAAADAAKYFGAKMGITNANGRCGVQSYAIPTKDHSICTLPLTVIQLYVTEFLAYAQAHPELIFILTPIGCGLAGYSPTQIWPLFKGVLKLSNVRLPVEFEQLAKKPE
jgi:hypothetical protein